MLHWGISRAKEPSTWACLAGLAVIFGLSADQWQVMSNALAAVAAAVSMFVKEQAPSE